MIKKLLMLLLITIMFSQASPIRMVAQENSEPTSTSEFSDPGSGSHGRVSFWSLIAFSYLNKREYQFLVREFSPVCGLNTKEQLTSLSMAYQDTMTYLRNLDYIIDKYGKLTVANYIDDYTAGNVDRAILENIKENITFLKEKYDPLVLEEYKDKPETFISVFESVDVPELVGTYRIFLMAGDPEFNEETNREWKEEAYPMSLSEEERIAYFKTLVKEKDEEKILTEEEINAKAVELNKDLIKEKDLGMLVAYVSQPIVKIAERNDAYEIGDLPSEKELFKVSKVTKLLDLLLEENICLPELPPIPPTPTVPPTPKTPTVPKPEDKPKRVPNTSMK